MVKSIGKSFTEGSVPKHLISISIPMFAINLLQLAYGIINTVWIGHIVGTEGIGATTVSMQVILILIGISSGITIATTILVSQYYGAKNMEMVEKVINNSFSIVLIIGIILTIAGIAFSNTILRLMNTPAGVFREASSYLKISLVSFLVMFLAYLAASILRGIGDTITPLIFYVVGVVLNAILDPLMIIGIPPFPKLGLNGAAYASIIAQGSTMAVGLIYLRKKKHILSINPKKFRLDRDISMMIIKIGIPSAVQQTLVSVGSAVITTFVNVYGDAAIGAYGAASRIDSLAAQPSMSIGAAASTVTGQNLGARKPERIKDIFRWGITMAIGITVVITIVVLIFPGQLLSIFGIANDAEVLSIGKTYLRIVSLSYMFYAIMYMLTGIINGAGHTVITMVFSILSIWLVRILLAIILSGTALGLKGIWIAIVVSNVILMLANLIYYFTGKWKKEVIKHDEIKP